MTSVTKEMMQRLFPTTRSFVMALFRMQRSYVLTVGIILVLIALVLPGSLMARLFAFTVAYAVFFPFHFWWACSLISGRLSADTALAQSFPEMTDAERDAVYKEVLRQV